jgi:hypothetical protein
MLNANRKLKNRGDIIVFFITRSLQTLQKKREDEWSAGRVDRPSLE